MPLPLSTLNTTAMIVRTAPLLVKMNLAPPAVIVIVVRPTMSGPGLLLQPGPTRRSSCRNGSMSAVGLCLSVTMIPWLRLRNYSAAGARLAGCCRILESAVETASKMGTGTGTGIDAGGDDDFLVFSHHMNDDRAQIPNPKHHFQSSLVFPLFLFPTLTRTRQEERDWVKR